jgi:hypothetical protein
VIFDIGRQFRNRLRLGIFEHLPRVRVGQLVNRLAFRRRQHINEGLRLRLEDHLF